MAFYDFILKPFKRATSKKVKRDADSKVNVLSLPEMMEELGVVSEGVIGSYEQEENPDVLAPDTYIFMQQNDGTVRSIVRIMTMPIVATPIKIIPGEKDKGEADFIKTVLMGPAYMGGMSTPLPFVIADMCRAIFEGFRLYEKVPQIIDMGKWKGKIGWRKLAPRDSMTVKLRADEHGGFMGAKQIATFGQRTVNVVLPPEKCLLFTFQKERHFLYGESILKTAYYHYDKKHKLYYLAHKKAEVDAVGLKILKVTQPTINESERTAAEEAVEQIGVNTRITLPPGFDLEIDRSPSGYSVLDLIRHHDSEIMLSALTQVSQIGTQQKYAYPYGKGYQYQNLYLSQAISSIMRSMEHTLNEWVIAPLIDWNFKTNAYPKLKFTPLTDSVQMMLNDIFYAMIKRKDFQLPSGLENKVLDSMAEKLGLEYKSPTKDEAFKSFENGKKIMSNSLNIPAPVTTKNLKAKLVKKYVQLKDTNDVLIQFETLGKNYSLSKYNNLRNKKK